LYDFVVSNGFDFVFFQYSLRDWLGRAYPK